MPGRVLDVGDTSEKGGELDPALWTRVPAGERDKERQQPTEHTVPRGAKRGLQERARAGRSRVVRSSMLKRRHRAPARAADMPSHVKGKQSFRQLSTFTNGGPWSVSRHGKMLPETSPQLLLSLTWCDRAAAAFWGRESSPPKQPVIAKATLFCRRAKEKIKGVGGACVLVA